MKQSMNSLIQENWSINRNEGTSGTLKKILKGVIEE